MVCLEFREIATAGSSLNYEEFRKINRRANHFGPDDQFVKKLLQARSLSCR